MGQPRRWSLDQPLADVTVMPLSYVCAMQARLGDLMVVGLPHFIGSRLGRGNKSPVLPIVDEIPQLVTPTLTPATRRRRCW